MYPYIYCRSTNRITQIVWEGAGPRDNLRLPEACELDANDP